ncbi:MAG: SRPBCC family protein [Saprospiraceae bacterium]|nr:SRPBCC family protein [Saprospiraceae bacterium]
MKALKVILGILGVLIAGYLVLCLVGPKKVDASSSTSIMAPAAIVYQQIGQLENWVDWGPWQNMDSTMKVTYSDKTEGVGASYSWTSENMGAGNLEITEADPPNSMKTKLKFGDYAGYNYGNWDLKETDGTTDITWSMTSDPTPFFFRGMMVLMGMDKSIEKDFANGLASIKAIAEEQAAKIPTSFGGYEVKKVDHPGGVFAGIREEVQMNSLPDFLASSYEKVMGAMATQQTPMAGPPCGLYYTWDEATQTSDMVAAIPIGEALNLGEDVSIIEIPASKAAVIDYYGSYAGVGAAHEAAGAFMSANGLTAKEPCIEMYITDPTTEPDTSKWLTQVIYFY